MKTSKLICQVCENHCELQVELEDGEVFDVSGNRCMKGFIYAQQEAGNLEEPEEHS